MRANEEAVRVNKATTETTDTDMIISTHGRIRTRLQMDRLTIITCTQDNQGGVSVKEPQM